MERDPHAIPRLKAITAAQHERDVAAYQTAVREVEITEIVRSLRGICWDGKYLPARPESGLGTGMTQSSWKCLHDHVCEIWRRRRWEAKKAPAA